MQRHIKEATIDQSHLTSSYASHPPPPPCPLYYFLSPVVYELLLILAISLHSFLTLVSFFILYRQWSFLTFLELFMKLTPDFFSTLTSFIRTNLLCAAKRHGSAWHRWLANMAD
jgi:hypothetical protein